MRINLKLSQMGLILVSVPFFFEILFVGILTGLLHQAEDEIRREQHSKDIVAHANILTRSIIDAGTAVGAYGYTRSPMFKKTYETAFRKVSVEVDQLDALVRDNPQQLAKLRHIKTSVDRTLNLIASARKSFEQMPGLSLMIGDPDISDKLGRLTALIGKIQIDIGKFVEAEQQIEKESPARQARTRGLILTALFGGVVASFMLAVGLAIFFSKVVTSRHQVLADNTRRLAKSQPLNPPLDGCDEIAHLDRVFHAMVKSVQESDRVKKQLIAVVSHELRTPLTSVEATLSLLEAGALGDLNDEVRSRLRTAEVDVMRLIGLINDLLDLEKMEAGKMEMSFGPVRLGSVIERSLFGVEGYAQLKKVTIEVPRSTALVYADENRLVQVVVNLLSNAIKFSPPSGKIMVEVIDSPEAAELRVRDQGRGIPQNFKDLVFERFCQVELADGAQKGGSGLGLTICKAIIEQHGGTIGVDSEEGQGSTFWFRLPKPASDGDD